MMIKKTHPADRAERLRLKDEKDKDKSRRKDIPSEDVESVPDANLDPIHSSS